MRPKHALIGGISFLNPRMLDIYVGYICCKAQFTRIQEASKEWAYKLEEPIDKETNQLLKGN